MTGWIEQIARSMGYLGYTLLTFLENVFPPLPSEVIMPLGGYMAAQGELTLWGIILAGTVGSILGAIVLYYVGKYFNEDRLTRWADKNGGWLLLTKGDVEGAFRWFDRHGKWAVFVCRLIPGLRSLISIPAGACGMGMGTFLLYTAAGTALWSGLLAYAGNLLGAQYQDIGAFLQWLTYVIIALIVVSIAWWVIQKRRERREQTSQR